MEYYNNILCISGNEFIKTDVNINGIVSMNMYRKLSNNKELNIIRRSCYGNPALIEYDTLHPRYQRIIIEKYGDPKKAAEHKPFADQIQADAKAVEFFSNHEYNTNKRFADKIQEYCNDAAILNTLKVFVENKHQRKMAFDEDKKFWTKAIAAIKKLSATYPNDLPLSEKRLKLTYLSYIKNGYSSLISSKFNNDNARKVSVKLERLILSLYSQPNKPYTTTVHDMFRDYMSGKIEVVDCETGEMFNRMDFMKLGSPITISESTVWSYLNNPLNRAIVDKVRMGGFEYNNTHRPFNHRHSPNYSFSKITMDDRDLPRKDISGKRVKAYYSFDVASECLIGFAHSMHKDDELLIECLRDMFRLIDKNGFRMPLQVEVEHHLVSKYFDMLDEMFPFMRICNPGNSREKRAEHKIKQKKYGTEKELQTGIGRFYLKSEANRITSDKINNEFKEKMYAYDTLVADDIKSIFVFNNSLHSKQKKYPGMTRWEVLLYNMNPDLPQVNKGLVYKCIGNKTETSLRNSQYCSVQNNKYVLPNPEIVKKLQTNNYGVDAYWLPSLDGSIAEVYLYQNGNYLCKCNMIETYQEAMSERTAHDEDVRIDQAKYTARFDKIIKENKVGKIEIIKNEDIVAAEMAYASAEVVQDLPNPSKGGAQELGQSLEEMEAYAASYGGEYSISSI